MKTHDKKNIINEKLNQFFPFHIAKFLSSNLIEPLKKSIASNIKNDAVYDYLWLAKILLQNLSTGEPFINKKYYGSKIRFGYEKFQRTFYSFYLLDESSLFMYPPSESHNNIIAEFLEKILKRRSSKNYVKLWYCINYS